MTDGRAEVPEELAEAERAWRWRAEHPRGLGLSTRQKVQLRMLLAEYDRMRPIVEAATALVALWRVDVSHIEYQRGVDTMARAVEGEQ